MKEDEVFSGNVVSILNVSSEPKSLHEGRFFRLSPSGVP